MAAREAGFAALSELSRSGSAHWSGSPRSAPSLDRRAAAGKCGGATATCNVRLFEGKPTLFDCLEFSDELASVDVLYDLAFLLMDLEHRGLADFANLVLSRYLDVTGEDDGLAAMALFLSLRAAIRAHVTGTAMEWAAQPEAKTGLGAEAQPSRPLRCAATAAFLPHGRDRGGSSGAGK